MKLPKINPLTSMFYHIVVVSIFGILLLCLICIITYNAMIKKDFINLDNKIPHFQKANTERELIDVVLNSVGTHILDIPKQIYSYTNKKGEVFGNAKVIEDATGAKIFVLNEIANKQKKLQTKPLEQNKTLRLTVVFENNTTEGGIFLIRSISLFGGELIIGKDTQQTRLLFSLIKRIAFWSVIPTIIFSFIVGILFTNRSSKKIYIINETLASLAKGDFNARINSIDNFSDDILSIVENINIMADSHQNTLETLNHISSDIAHDLKSPLQRVHLSITKIQKFKDLPNEINITLKTIQNEINNVLKIFNSILEISQMDVSTFKPSFTRINLTKLTNKFFELYEPFVKESKHEFIAEFEINKNFFFMGNEELIGQLIVNLIENSVRHTPEGVKIKIQLKHYDKYIRLIVSDNGSGIPTSHHKKVLNRFYRMETSRTTHGSGLGLSLVNAIAKLHNAKLTLKDNDPGLIVILDFHSA